MQQKTEMTTLTQVLEKLRQRGLDNEISMDENNVMLSKSKNRSYQPEDLLIFRTFRFEGESDPDDNAVIYMVEDKQGDIGYILDVYGAYSNHEGPEFDDFIKKIPMEERDDQELFE